MADNVLSAVLGSIHADMARVERVGMNIANAQTVGYKRELVAATAFGSQVESALSVHTDARPGVLKPTGQSLDLALASTGWFEVMTPQGPAYTRQGQFQRDAQGRLVTAQGDPVMGTGGVIHLQDASPRIDGAGRIFERTNGGSDGPSGPVAQIKVVQFPAGAALQKLGSGLVQLRGEAPTPPEGSVQVQQGFLEQSNVSHMHEMVRLLETARHLESLQKVALAYDEMLAGSIRRLGDTQ